MHCCKAGRRNVLLFTYGKGIYRETIAALAPGCLETLVETIGAKMDEWA